MIQPRQCVKKLKPYVPGKTISEIKEKYGLEDVVKLGSNENPLGASPKALEAIRNSVETLNIYPDSDLKKLRGELARFWGVDAGNVIPGNGSDEVIDLAARCFLGEGEKVLIPAPTFSFYEICVTVAGGGVEYISLNQDLELETSKLFEQVDDKTKLVYICRPNNPTGKSIPRPIIEEICEKFNGIVIVDEAYAEFSDDAPLVPLTKKVDNLLLLRTFSKAYGLAGMRIGYGIANKELIASLLKIKPPFSVSSLAQEAAIAALKDTRFLENTIRLVKEGREYLFKELSKLGFEVFPSQANFLFAYTESVGLTSKELTEKLLEKGIIIRDCSSFPGIKNEYVRISIGTENQNKKLVEVLESVLK